VVVPAYNEAESLPELHRELSAALEAMGTSWEVLYVDDGSRDGTDQVIERLCAADAHAHGILLSRNFGKSAALATGFKAVRGAFVCTLDADLQDDPAELPRLFACSIRVSTSSRGGR
jgi:glycosyltransferase involved in cell wall biosynthesis